MFAQQLETRGIYYAVNYEDITEDWLIGDELRISQVLINFLSNAVKFTGEGKITVTFRQMMLQNGKSDLMISVCDTGKGMEPEFINRIFRPFEQENNDIARNYGGTGLGMAITDNLVKLMDGEIVVKSTPGEGSEFSVFLSLPISEEKEATAAEKKSAPNKAESADDTYLSMGSMLMPGQRSISTESDGCRLMWHHLFSCDGAEENDPSGGKAKTVSECGSGAESISGGERNMQGFGALGNFGKPGMGNQRYRCKSSTDNSRYFGR